MSAAPVGPMSPKDRRELRDLVTRMRHVLTGTLYPHHEVAPEDVEVDAMIVEAEAAIADMELLLLADEERRTEDDQ